MWIIAAILSAVFAGLTSILAKCGIRKTDSDVATALRTIVVLIFSWVMVFVVGSFHTITTISGKSLLFLVLSGLATGASWITVLTVLLAIIFFNERNNLIVKLISTALLGIGVLMMVEKKAVEEHKEKRSWIIYAIGSAVFAALTSILGKIGVSGVESNLGTAIRTIVVLIMAWVVVLIKGKQTQVKSVDKKELVFISLSGIATGASWLCYYYAIQNGIVSVVVPIDKLSIIVSIAFSYFVFKEKLTKKAFAGLALMVIGTLMMAIFA